MFFIDRTKLGFQTFCMAVTGTVILWYGTNRRFHPPCRCLWVNGSISKVMYVYGHTTLEPESKTSTVKLDHSQWGFKLDIAVQNAVLMCYFSEDNGSLFCLCKASPCFHQGVAWFCQRFGLKNWVFFLCLGYVFHGRLKSEILTAKYYFNV